MNERYSPYIVIDEKYARGGNANILLVKDTTGKKYILKSIVIHGKGDVKKVKRFINEVKVVEKFQNIIEGIVPILHKHIPKNLDDINSGDIAKIKGTEFWYVMELAIPIKDKLNENNSVEEVIDCMISLSSTLVKLHGKDIVHRDIKPSNLYSLSESWAFGDFGLVEYPELSGDTSENERIGNYETIAPEMRRLSVESKNSKPADVWSMAKTLVMLLKGGESQYFEGIYSAADDSVSLKNVGRLSRVPLAPLERLIESALKYDPNERVDIAKFLESLIIYREILQGLEGVVNVSELSKLRYDSEEPVIHNDADMREDTSRILLNFKVEMIPDDQLFIDDGLENQVRILKYISMRLENFCENKFIVSPVHRHSKNNKLPCVKVFIPYTKEECKFVSYILVDDNSIVDFTRSAEIRISYDDEWQCANTFVNYINKTAFDLVARV